MNDPAALIPILKRCLDAVRSCGHPCLPPEVRNYHEAAAAQALLELRLVLDAVAPVADAPADRRPPRPRPGRQTRPPDDSKGTP